MAKVSFKKGALANLPSTYSEGTIYITTDERAMYVDINGNTRIRLGDFQEFETVAQLEANTNPSTSALYYVSGINCLAKWNGSDYIKINLDTGATDIEVTGSGNAVTSASYNPTTRKITLTKGNNFATSADIGSAIGDLGNDGSGNAYSNVKAYVDDKMAGVASDGAIVQLTNRITTLEGKPANSITSENIESWNASSGKAHEHANKSVLDGITAQDVSNWNGASADVATLIGGDNGKSARAIAAEELAAQLIPENADASLDTLQEIAAWIQAHPDDASAMNSAIGALQAILDGIGDTGAGEKATVVSYVTDAISALNIGNYALASELTAVASRVSTLEGSSHTHGNLSVLEGITAQKTAEWDGKQDKVVFNTAYNSVNNKAATMSDVNNALTWGSF